jgi:hypothetical protein
MLRGYRLQVDTIEAGLVIITDLSDIVSAIADHSRLG